MIFQSEDEGITRILKNPTILCPLLEFQIWFNFALYFVSIYTNVLRQLRLFFRGKMNIYFQTRPFIDKGGWIYDARVLVSVSKTELKLGS